MQVLSAPDLVITIAYFTIPFQLLFSLWKFPRLQRMPFRIIVLLVLFAFFIFLCGAGHMMKCIGKTQGSLFYTLNVATAVVSLATAIYLVPMIPAILSEIDDAKCVFELNNELKESKSKLFTFMAFLCHEMRNPLFAITSSCECLADTTLTQEQHESVSTMFDSALLMLRLVNDVLDISKIDSGKLELEAHVFDLRRLLISLSQNMARQVKRMHGDAVRLTFSLDESVPRAVIGDSSRILQIVYNLLSNSCKFTNEGNIHLAVSVCKNANAKGSIDFCKEEEEDESIVTLPESVSFEDNMFSMALLRPDLEQGAPNAPLSPDTVTLKMTVSDTGIGIPPERLKTIFEAYSQAKLSDFRQHGGTGLGLTIISSLISTMGGSVQVRSKPGEGATFELEIPVRVPQDDVTEDFVATENMSDPFLHSRRLPVYDDENCVPVVAAKTGMNSAAEKLVIDAQPPLSLSRDCSGNAMAVLVSDTSSTSSSQLEPFNMPKGSSVILVVDDNSVNRKIMGKMLSTFNLEYETAENGQEAVNMVFNSRNATKDPSRPYYSLVFMDLSMPVMDGFEAISAIRNAEIDVPMVALTANVLKHELNRALALGALECLSKPLLRKDLHSVCKRYLTETSSTSS